MSKTVRIVLIIGVILVALMALTFRGRRSPVGALAAYKAELRAKGEKLSAEELGFPRPPESSGNLNLLLAGVSQLGSAQIDPGRLELMHFVSAGRVEVAWARSQLAMSSIPFVLADIFCAQFETATDAVQMGHTKAEALDYVRRSFQSYHPLRSVFKTTPTTKDYQRVLREMNDDGRTGAKNRRRASRDVRVKSSERQRFRGS